MKLSCLSMIYHRFPLEKAFSEAQRLGLQGVEVWGGRPHAYVHDVDDELLANLESWKRNYNVEISAYTPENCSYPYNLSSQSAKERRETVEYFKLALDAAKAMGAPLIQITPGDPGYSGDPDTDWGHLVEGLQEVCAHGVKTGVAVVMETLSTQESLILNTAAQLQKLIREVNSPAMYGMVDLVSPYIMYEPVSNYFDRLGDKMRHIHVCDSDGATADHLMIGDGVIPFSELFSLIERCQYPHYVSIELGMYSPHGGDPELYVEQFVKRMRDAL